MGSTFPGHQTRDRIRLTIGRIWLTNRSFRGTAALGNDGLWVMYFSVPLDICGAYGSCNIGISPVCECLDHKFVPRDPGGVRRTNLSCEGDVFLEYSRIKLPGARNSWHNDTMNLDECLKKCSYMGYTQLDIRKRSGCLLWYDELELKGKLFTSEWPLLKQIILRERK
ncbi:hypothetical protein ACS0TY_023860 [Phlomoides rotata]